MLAASGRPTGSLTGWTAELKADGFRCQVAIHAARRVARTRGGHDIADRLPELEVLSHIGVDMILDGELIAGAGRPADFPALAGAVASKRRDRIRTNFVAFDLLALDGQLLINWPHADRRQLLEHLGALAPEALNVVPSYPAVDVDDLLAACDELDLMRRTLTVAEQRSRGKGGKRLLGEPKSEAGNRTLAIPVSLVGLLATHLLRRELTAIDEDAFMFVSPEGKPLYYTSWRRRVWSRPARPSGWTTSASTTSAG